MKTELNIEESARLIELGVDSKLASHKESNFYNGISSEEYKVYHLFTLTDILSILPKEIVADTIMQEKDRCPLLMEWDPKIRRWRTAYAYIGMPVNMENPIGVAPELIDALNSLLIWAIENKHINLNSDKR